jgi:type I restriction enzyme S subunit
MRDSRANQTAARVAFGDVVRLNGERSAGPERDGFARFVGLEHIDPGVLKIRRWGDIADGSTFTSVFRPGQVLFGKRRAYQRKVAVADFSGVCSGDIYVLEPKDARLLPELLPFICQTEAFFEHAVGTSAGSLSPRTNWDSLASYEFSLPPLEEQRGIAGVGRSLTTLTECEYEAEQAAERARRSLLVQTFRPDRGVRDVFPSHWRVARASRAGDIQLGQQRHPKYEHGTNVRPYLRVANVLDGRIRFDDLLEMHFPESELSKFELEPGDILLNEGQSTELVGRSAIYRGEVPGCCFQKTLLRFRCGDSLLPEFAQGFFQHCLYTGQFARNVVQTTSMAHLTAVRFKEMEIPVPPMPEQVELSQRLVELNLAVGAMRERRAQAMAVARAAIGEMLAS